MPEIGGGHFLPVLFADGVSSTDWVGLFLRNERAQNLRASS